jgi:hypothetical protein
LKQRKERSVKRNKEKEKKAIRNVVSVKEELKLG